MVTGSRVERKKYQSNQKRSSNKRPMKKNNKNTARKWLKRMVILLITLFFLALMAGGGLFAYYAMNAPELTKSDLQGQISSKIYDRNGELIKELGGQNRDLMTADEVPTVLKDAVLAIEDARFYSHKGVDPIRIVGSVIANLQAGQITQGGSTITQQLVKLSVFSTDFQDQTLERKAQEAWLSLGLEQEYSKDEILTMYLNKMFYSNNTYGVKTAAKNFFGKNIQDINLADAALLAGIPQAPSDYDPYSFPEDAKERRDLVLSVMLERKLINQSQHDEAVNTPIASQLVALDHDSLAEYDLSIDSYIDIVRKEVQDKMNLNIFTDGVEVYTNLDMDAQKKLHETVNNNSAVVFPNDQIQTAVSIIDVETGQLVAVMGGRKQEVAFGLNRANTLDRSVGSTIKPLIDFGPAFEYLNYSTGTTIVDEPYTYTDGVKLNNFDFEHKGQMTLREALAGSRNIPALKLLQEVGMDNAYAFLQKLNINITSDYNTRELVESNSIGAAMTPIQLTAAYAAISNNGEYIEPYTVSRVVTSAGTVQEFTYTPRRAMKDSTAYMLVDILKGVPGPFAATAQIEGLHHAGKTGSTDYDANELAKLGLDSSTYAARDGWYAGITTKYAIASWIGYDDAMVPGNQLTLDDTRIPQAIYAEMMTFMMQNQPNTDWKKPDSVVAVEIEKYSSPLQLPGPYTPAEMRSTELFIKGSEPTQQSLSYGRYMNAPAWFDANYDEETKSIIAEWSNLTDNGVFELSLNGVVVYSGTGTSFSMPIEAADGEYILRLRIVDGNSSSDTLVVTLTLTTTSEETDSSESESGELPPDETDSSSEPPEESLPPETSESVDSVPPA